jgi:hypothetical protein
LAIGDTRDNLTLIAGTDRQQAAHRVLQSLHIYHVLAAYHPVLTGTIPLDIDTPESDLDIICETYDLRAFANAVTNAFGKYDRFTQQIKDVFGVASVIANFWHDGFEIEIFGQAKPVIDQNAYRHLQVESRLLAIGGDPVKTAIRRLKQGGMKTEPAFSEYFGLQDDPYKTLMRLSYLNDSALHQAIQQSNE